MADQRLTKYILRIIFLGLVIFDESRCRNHTLTIKNDKRAQFVSSTFGFLQGGYLDVNMTTFTYRMDNSLKLQEGTFGFTLDKSSSSGISSYWEQTACILMDSTDKEDKNVAVTFFKFDLDNRRITIQRVGTDVQKLTIKVTSPGTSSSPGVSSPGAFSPGVTTAAGSHSRKRRKVEAQGTTKFHDRVGNDTKTVTGTTKHALVKPTPTTKKVLITPSPSPASAPAPTQSKAVASTAATEAPSVTEASNDTSESTAESAAKLVNSIPLNEVENEKGEMIWQASFRVEIHNPEEEGLYNLYFHSCPNTNDEDKAAINLTLHIVERNPDSFLSVGNVPLPTLYFSFCVLYLLTSFVWLYMLRKSKSEVYKIHYLMFAIMIVKSVSFLFHAINYHFIGKLGYHEEAWAVLYYITHLLKGVLLFTVIALIGAGWAFVKHMLSDRDKKIILVAISLQVLTNVAQIILEETEEGSQVYSYWNEILILVDLLCCGAILFPVVWSIRHLHDASQTDGKAAMNLNKLKLFRHFYIIVVCYIYSTRIVVYLLKITVPFHYSWFSELFIELATFIFFVITGYKFQPADNNPYLQVPTEEDEEQLEMEEVLTHTGMYDTLTKVNIKHSDRDDHEVTQDRPQPKQREASHEYD
ncbi:protein GPR107 isoform X3 [Lingula anatina]|uniref:Protein GPR107 isoform X3 n=1 Tax=Lingula anatina TaxID=7574 RepID=A0A1S3JPF2_LINAN|nr:protein GPR107 isoform X3 [Lingula anatina]|eukprot:XP_013412245.1 protein GPR107 isoform X3 [Lingula anatina]